MTGNGSANQSPILSPVAEWLANREILPTSIQAVLGYYADTGVFDYPSIKLKLWVDSEITNIIDRSFENIERNIESEFGQSRVDFAYDTKLTLPAELTLGYIYGRILERSPNEFNPILREAQTDTFEFTRAIFDKKGKRRRDEQLQSKYSTLVKEVQQAEIISELVVEALIDGDMRDALNDDEFEDFTVDFELANTESRRKVAKIAQETLQESIEEKFTLFPKEVKEAYESAVDISVAHQDADESFRELLDKEDPTEAIRSEYKYVDFEDPPNLFDESVRNLPYFKTQYERVGVIYDGMIDMYREAGFEINNDFKRSIILAIIGAQIWLDDVSDYRDDKEEQQLTPVTAEYILGENEKESFETITEIVEAYLSIAKRYAGESGTPLTGIAIEYIYRKGEPSSLPQ